MIGYIGKHPELGDMGYTLSAEMCPVVNVTPYSADFDSYFATYETLKRALSPAPALLPNGEKAAAPPLSLPAVMLAGGSAGVAMWAIAIPPDVSFFLSPWSYHAPSMCPCSTDILHSSPVPGIIC